MNATENILLTGFKRLIWEEKAEKLPFSEVIKTINHSLAATALASNGQ